MSNYFGLDFPSGSDSKESACDAGDLDLIPGSGRSPGEENGTIVFLLGESHGQRSLIGYSPWDCNEWVRTKRLTLSLHFVPTPSSRLDVHR